ncbi:NADPH dehydrogenase [Colletotrichum plurivorum]|uniref:NADPH dehydrogenase n=1 Tax=Colletotrichum plurivorum TaxID=2175906 RepID=A0A8H6KFA3_9PEZI|nr:NADPH dehydrogenase [Colletotrichum plurivorum]
MPSYLQGNSPGTPLSRSRTPTSANGVDVLTPVAAKGVSFFTPAQDPPAGTAIKTKDDKEMPKLFTPINIRGVTMQNRIWVSPMCQYSAHEGFHTPWHLVHYGGMITRGPGMVMIEATAVQARGRITPEDSGIWLDAHVEGLRKTVEFAHSQNALIAIQLAHAGRKASTAAPFIAPYGATAVDEAGGWPSDVFGPGDETHAKGYPTPRAMTLQEIEEVKKGFIAAVERAVHAGFDIVELHFAHGYLVSTFLSPVSNKRTDKYGGSFENRARLALELVEGARAVMPADMPLFVRISATDWLAENPEWKGGETWTVEESAKLAPLLADRGVDVLDVSSGAMHPLQKLTGGPGYQAALAKRIKRAVGDRMLVSTVGTIENGVLAEQLLNGGRDEDDTPLDLVATGRMFMKNPGLVWAFADDLGVSIKHAKQFGWPFVGRG